MNNNNTKNHMNNQDIIHMDTNTNKCKKIVEEIYNDKSKWEILAHDKNERNGILLCKSI